MPRPSLVVRFVRRVRGLAHVNWALSDQALVSAVNFLTTVLVARMVDIAEFGVFSIAWMIILLSKDLQNASINAPMMSIGPKHAATDLPHYYGAAILQQCAFTTVCFAVVIVGAALTGIFFPHLVAPGFAFALAAAVAADQLQDFVRRYFYANDRPVAVLVNDLINCGSRLGIIFLMYLYAPTNAVGVLWVMAGCALVGVAAGLLARGSVRFDRNWTTAIALRHWHFSKWMAATSVLRWFSSNLIIMVSGAVLGPQAIGAIRASINVMAPRNVLILGLTNVVLVHGSRKLKNGGKPALRRYLAKVTGVGIVFDICVAIVAFTFADEIMLYLYGPSFVPYSFVLYWLACTHLVHYFTFPAAMGLQILEYTRPFFTSAVIEAAFGAMASYLLVIWFGLPGTLFGMATVNVILLACLAPPLIRRLRD